MKNFTVKSYIYKVLFFVLMLLTIYVTILRIIGWDILNIQFALLDVISNNKLQYLWKVNFFMTSAILLVQLFKYNSYLWLYFILEKSIFLGFLILSVCTEDKCVRCEYYGSIKTSNFNYILVFNLTIILLSTILFFILSKKL